MALDTQLSNVARNTALDALTALYNAGKLRIYDGAKPASAQVAVSTQVLLAELVFGNPAFAAAASGVATANAITSDSSADASGTATWFRIFKSDGTTVLEDGTVGLSGCNMNLNSITIQIAAVVSISGGTITVPAAGS